MHLESFLDGTAQEINQELEKFFPKKISAKWCSANLGKAEYSVDEGAVQGAIANPVWDFLGRGGKRWRPALAILACKAVGGSKKDVLSFCVIPELVHNGTIMVDDVEDNSVLRRGRPSTHVLFGVDVAVNAGNSMYFLPLSILYNNKKLHADKKSELYDSYARNLLRLSFGQAMDIHWHRGNGNVSEKAYLQMCVYKTGSLAAFSAEMGAIIGNATRAQKSALSGFATSIGVAFQIHDDVLNIKPKSLDWGKETGDDIKEGKRTLMVIHALEKLPKKERERLIGILDSREKSEGDVREAISLIERSGGIEYAALVAKKIVSASWKKLDRALAPSDAKALLREFADYLIKRDI